MRSPTILSRAIRAKLVPEFAEEFIAATGSDEKKMAAGLILALVDYILAARGLNARGWAVEPESFRPDMLAAHVSMNYKLIADRADPGQHV